MGDTTLIISRKNIDSAVSLAIKGDKEAFMTLVNEIRLIFIELQKVCYKVKLI